MGEQVEGNKPDHVTREAARLYEDWFVPANFQRWASVVAEAAEVGPGQIVLDVGCGTGALTREAARRAKPAGRVVGLDKSANMLSVAREKSPEIEWHHAEAEAIPFGEASFDVVLSQLAFMFFEDKVTALREMYRVLKPGGRLWVVICGDLEQSPGYHGMAKLVQQLTDGPVTGEYLAPFALGNESLIRSLLEDAGLSAANLQTARSLIRYESMESWVHTDFRGWTISNLITEELCDRLVQQASSALRHLVKEDGSVEFEMMAYFVSTTKN